MKVLVIGGGVIGTTTAWCLRQDGHDVTVLDRADALAAEGSFANGGMLHASHTEPWNSPAAIRQLIRWIGRENSPLLLRPSQLPNLAGWGMGFLRYSRPRHHRRSTRINTRLARYSQRMMQLIREQTGIRYDEAQRGIIKIFRSRRELDEAALVAQLTAELGVRHQILDVSATIALEPALSGIRKELVGAIYYPDDESGDACLFTRRLGEIAVRQGVRLELRTAVQRLELKRGAIHRVVTSRGMHQADCYVLAAGVDAPLLAKPIGLHLPIRPVKGYSASLPVAGCPGVPLVPIIDEQHKVVMTQLGERLRIAGTAEFAGYDYSIRESRVRAIVEQALTNLPQLAGNVDRNAASRWACLRPLTVDGPPILGRTSVPNLFLNVGSGHLGWTFAAGCAQVLADILGGRPSAIDLDGLTLARFGCRGLIERHN
ncbi:MAG TPA: D-amino acid dehydrogenase [Nitrococcus sp.]|nr:D-amino acid dehydrogenase [Nitrococcus sp.]